MSDAGAAAATDQRSGRGGARQTQTVTNTHSLTHINARTHTNNQIAGAANKTPLKENMRNTLKAINKSSRKHRKKELLKENKKILTKIKKDSGLIKC